MNNSLVTVITVCYNSEKTIRSTIESVLKQDYRPLQYVIIDGKSVDSTMEIINSYKNKFVLEGIALNICSEEDEGIYDAMNKGVRLSQGKWVNFMNSDDNFHFDGAVSYMMKNDTSDIDVLYGNEYIRDKEGKLIFNKRENDLSVITKYLPFCHQSVFVKKEKLIKYPFDLEYKYIADLDFFLKLYFLDNAKFKYCDVAVSDYFSGGQSFENVLDAFKEGRGLRIKYNYPGNIEWIEKLKDCYRYLKFWRMQKIAKKSST